MLFVIKNYEKNVLNSKSDFRVIIIYLNHLSLWPLLQSLEERLDIVIIVDGKLHLLTHDANGDILEVNSTKHIYALAKELSGHHQPATLEG